MPRLIVCHCDPSFVAYAVCERCEEIESYALRVTRDALGDDHPAAASFDALIAAYEPSA